MKMFDSNINLDIYGKIFQAEDGDRIAAFELIRQIKEALKSEQPFSQEYKYYLQKCFQEFDTQLDRCKSEKEMQGAFARSFNLLGKKGRRKSDQDRERQIASFIKDEINKGQKVLTAIHSFQNSELGEVLKGAMSVGILKNIYYKWKDKL